MDVGQLHTDIHSAQQSDTHSLEIIATLSGPDADPRGSLDGSGLLCYDGHVWVPDANDLHLQILLNNHHHPVSGHLGQNKTLELIRRDYTWPGVRMFVKDYCKPCTTCARSITGRTSFFDNSRSRKNHGTQFQSMLLISYHLPQDTPQYW